MVIDPRLYEKVTGRSGNPAERLAIASAALSERKRKLVHQREAARERRRSFWRFGVDGVIMHAIFSGRVPGALIIVALGIVSTLSGL